MEEGKPAGSDKCTRVKSNGYTMRVRRSYIEYKGKEAYKRIDCPTSLSATCSAPWSVYELISGCLRQGRIPKCAFGGG